MKTIKVLLTQFVFCSVAFAGGSGVGELPGHLANTGPIADVTNPWLVDEWGSGIVDPDFTANGGVKWGNDNPYNQAPQLGMTMGPGSGGIRGNAVPAASYYTTVIMSDDQTNVDRIKVIAEEMAAWAHPGSSVEVGQSTPHNGFVVHFEAGQTSENGAFDYNHALNYEAAAQYAKDYGQYVRSIQLNGTTATIETGSLTAAGIMNAQQQTIELKDMPEAYKEPYLKSAFSMENQWVAIGE